MSETPAFRIAFIGCGSYARSLADSASKSSVLRIVSCFDTDAEAAESLSAKFGAQSHTDLNRLLGDDGVDAVVIATPNNAHMTPTVAAARAGKHVFVDKPMANTLEDALRMADAAETAGVTLAVGHNARRFPGHRKLKELLSEGVVGNPVTVEANFSHSGGLGLTPAMWRSHRSECPALPLMQLGVHFTDTMQYLLGEISEVSSFMTHIATPADNDDVTVSLLRFGSGLLGYLGSNYASPPVYYINIYGTAGNLHCEGGRTVSLRRAGSGDQEQFFAEPVDTQLQELEEFAACARARSRCEVDGDVGLRALAVVQAALKSHQERRPVTTGEVLQAARAVVSRNG